VSRNFGQEVQMKILSLGLGLILSSSALAAKSFDTFSYKDSFKVEKVVLKEVLLKDLMKLHKDLNFENKRMIAGKKSYLESLRTKLEGQSGIQKL
jgi:hypothetical protein